MLNVKIITHQLIVGFNQNVMKTQNMFLNNSYF